jgi:Icc-related predicted phosphoesterase
MISKLFSREPDTKVFFATDIHGSETCWRKFLNSGKHYEANIMILGGDMTGKALVPIVGKDPTAGTRRCSRTGGYSRAKTR